MSRPVTPSKLRRFGGMAMKAFFPFAAIRRTLDLAQDQATRTRSNLVVLKELGKGARDALSAPPQGEERDDSFNDAMERRREDALPAHELRYHFLARKRIAIGASLVFLAVAACQAILAVWSHSLYSLALAIVCGLSPQPLFFVIALGAQLRLWQLETRRLSVQERGGLEDFMRECPRWWQKTINPEISRARRDA